MDYAIVYAIVVVIIAMLFRWRELVSTRYRRAKHYFLKSKWKKHLNKLVLEKLLPPGSRAGWTLVDSRRGVRLWKRTISDFSSTEPVYASSIVIDSSTEDVVSVLSDVSLEGEWNSRCLAAHVIAKGSDGVSDVISVNLRVSGGGSQSYSRSWTEAENYFRLFSRAIGGERQSDVEWTYWSVKSIGGQNDDDSNTATTLVSLCLGLSVVYFSDDALDCLSSWLSSLQHFVLMQSATRSIKTSLPLPSSNEETKKPPRGSPKRRKKDSIMNSFPSRSSENQRLSWINLADISAIKVKNTALAEISDEWKLDSETKGVTIMKRKSLVGEEQPGLNSAKGTANMTVPPFFVLSYIADLEKGNLWNEMYNEGVLIEVIREDTLVCRLKYKPVFPTSPRDLCVVSGIREVGTGLVMAVNSVEHSYCPENEKFVRAETNNSGFLIVSTPGNKASCSVTYLARIDLKGRIPAFVINKIISVQPRCVVSLRDLVEREYEVLSVEEKTKWEEMTLDEFLKMRRKYLRRLWRKQESMENGTNEEEEEDGSDDVTCSNSEEEEEEEEEEEDNEKRVFDEERLVAPTPISFQEAEFPHNHNSRIDYRTLGNQICANVMAEFYFASGIDFESDFLTRNTQSGGWIFQSIDRDVLIMKKKMPNSKYDSFMGRGMIEVPPTLVWDAVRDSRTRFVYDNMLKSLEIVEEIESGLNIVYCVYETHNCFMKQGRDMCFLHAERQENGKFIVAGRSITHPKCPVTPNVIRAEVIASGWQIEPIVKQGKLHTLVSYVVQINLGGLAAGLINLIGKRQPLAIAYLRQHLIEQS
ncbi:uncharacterized protein [Oscarella lobularis]|uniref:uncharacterized protein n=1 Tax=Oscarella lobularis TaxID=121494 RepID=UPI00331433CE